MHVNGRRENKLVDKIAGEKRIIVREFCYPSPNCHGHVTTLCIILYD